MLATGGNRGHNHVFDLVSIEGQVVAEVRQATQDEYVLQTDGHLFSAILRHPGTTSHMLLLPMRHVPIGSRIRVTGICMLADANPFYGDVPFNILLRSFDDVQVVAQPSLLTVSNMLIVAGLLLLVLIAVGVRGWILERNVRRQTASIAYLERLRRRILEDINGDRPLAEIIEQITEVVTFRRQGAPCWCEITDGARLGNWSVDLSPLKIVQKTISGRSGTPLGTLFAAFPPNSKLSSEDTEALAMGAGLATLAIETRRLYQDLLRRSEFDLLTDIQNRFSLEKELDAHIDAARKAAGIFGLIYIDLDDFKLVNDRYGHHVGDLYLQEAASRMKHQLRPADILARLGGDEFAVLVPVARSRHEVQEIALRLDHCIEEPFVIDGHLLCGSASIGIALYPEDAVTKDDLLCIADDAMYAAKKQRKQKGAMETILPKT
jgi:diguanylate cyclase (GGDEF)-like protein